MSGSALRPGVWTVWFSAVLICVSLTKNPAYLIIILLAITTLLAAKRPEAANGPWRAFVNIGLTFFFVSVIYNILISHHGNTVILSLPSWIPVVGGPLTAEAAVFGAVFGLTFLCGVLAFAVLNISVGVGELLGFLPARLRGAATVISVALNFIPATIGAAAEISEAQTIRRLDYGGGATGKVKKAGAVFVPLIIMGLEKAVVMSESMESRAYGGPKPSSRKKVRGRWAVVDWAAAGAAILPAVFLTYCLISGQGWLAFSPYPTLAAPGFSLSVGLSLALLALPAFSR